MLKHEHWILPIELSKRDVLADLIDDEFIEIGSSATVYDKPEIIRWLASDDKSERSGTSFKVQELSEGVNLLTYISLIREKPGSEIKKAMRSSIWRLSLVVASYLFLYFKLNT